MNLPTSSPAPDPLEEAERLLKEAMKLDALARDAMERAEEAFEKLGRPLPLFDRLADDRRH